MDKKQMPELLSAEAINALAENAESIKGVITSNDEKMVLGGRHRGNQCCCPELVKYKFILCHVWIDAPNAACPGTTCGGNLE